jgi:hypothetical protein
MRSDSQLAGDGMQPDSPFALPDWVMALSEGERSGTSHCVEILGSVLTGH